MEKLKGSEFISPKDIQIVTDCCRTTAYVEHQRVRDALGIKHSKLTVKQYADYWGIELDRIVFKINDYR